MDFHSFDLSNMEDKEPLWSGDSRDGCLPGCAFLWNGLIGEIEESERCPNAGGIIQEFSRTR